MANDNKKFDYKKWVDSLEGVFEGINAPSLQNGIAETVHHYVDGISNRELEIIIETGEASKYCN